jgi:hypothetical protein
MPRWTDSHGDFEFGRSALKLKRSRRFTLEIGPTPVVPISSDRRYRLAVRWVSSTYRITAAQISAKLIA